MIILHVLHGLQLGGVAAVVRNLALNHGEDHIHIVALTQDTSPPAQERFRALYEDPHITVTVLNKPRGKGHWGVIRALRRLFKQPMDALIVHHEHVLPMVLPAALGRSFITIQVIHNQRLDAIPWHRHLGRRFFDHYVFVSESGRQEGRVTYRLPLSQTSTIRNGIPLSTFTPPSSPPALSFLFVGRLTAQKNLMGLIDRYERYATLVAHPAPLTILGQGEDQTALEARLARSPQSCLITLQPVSGDMPARYAEHAVLVLPSLYEGTPMVILEAMACGLGVIAHDVGDVSSLIDEDCGAVIDPNDVEAFAQAMVRMHDPIRLAKVRKHAVQRAQSFSDARMSEQYRTLLLTLKKSSGPKAG